MDWIISLWFMPVGLAGREIQNEKGRNPSLLCDEIGPTELANLFKIFSVVKM